MKEKEEKFDFEIQGQHQFCDRYLHQRTNYKVPPFLSTLTLEILCFNLSIGTNDIYFAWNHFPIRSFPEFLKPDCSKKESPDARNFCRIIAISSRAISLPDPDNGLIAESIIIADLFSIPPV